MDWEVVVLRKLMDDPSYRPKILGVVTKDHFVSTAAKYLFVLLKDVMDVGIVTNAMLAQSVSSKALKPEQERVLHEKIGELSACHSPLSSEVDYGLQALCQAAKTEHYFKAFRTAAERLASGDTDGAEAVVKSAVNRSSIFEGSNERCGTARTMSNLEAILDDEERFKTGFTLFDSLIGGARLGELWFWAAYTGEFKSTSLISIAHSNFVSGKNVFFASLEMDPVEIKRRLICYHAVLLGQPLQYTKVERQQFTDQEREVFRYVCNDFDTNSAYGDIRIWQPPLGVTILDVGRAYELECSHVDCEILVLDYIQKLRPIHNRERVRESLNETLDLAKRLAMESRDRKGTWLLSGYQTSTEGRKTAEKVGYYDIWALSETIGAGQVANVILWSLVTEKMRRNKEVKVGVAKSRNSSIQGGTHFLVANPEMGMLSKEPVREPVDLEDSGEFLKEVVEI